MCATFAVDYIEVLAMSIVAIITARAGSKRIPNKNIKNFLGKPMIAYAIETAIESGIFDEVMVSTDSEEIAEIAKVYGAKVPFMRSEATANDYATTLDVLLEVVATYKAQGVEFDELCCIYPCVPLLQASSLKDAYSKFQGEDFLMPVCKFPAPPERALQIKNEKLVVCDEKSFQMRSQDLPIKYHDVGMFYFANTLALLDRKNLALGATPYIINEWECQDIDNIEDWDVAEVKYLAIKERMKCSSK